MIKLRNITLPKVVKTLNYVYLQLQAVVGYQLKTVYDIIQAIYRPHLSYSFFIQNLMYFFMKGLLMIDFSYRFF